VFVPIGSLGTIGGAVAMAVRFYRKLKKQAKAEMVPDGWITPSAAQTSTATSLATVAPAADTGVSVELAATVCPGSVGTPAQST